VSEDPYKKKILECQTLLRIGFKVMPLSNENLMFFTARNLLISFVSSRCYLHTLLVAQEKKIRMNSWILDKPLSLRNIAIIVNINGTEWNFDL
jgi:hypothetical protein